MTDINTNESLKLYFLIAPALLFVNAVVASVFAIKYKERVHKFHAFLWLSYFAHSVFQGAVQSLPNDAKAILFFSGCFVVVVFMALFISEITGRHLSQKNNYLFFFFGFMASSYLFVNKAPFEYASLPIALGSTLPLLRHLPLLKEFKKLSFSQYAVVVTFMLVALHTLDFAYAGNKSNLVFVGYLGSLMLVVCSAAFSFASLIERAVLEVDMKEVLHNTARMTALGRMAAEIAHEIKNPLTVVTMNNRLLLQRIGSKTVDIDYLKSKLGANESMLSRLSAIISGLEVNSRGGVADEFVSTSLSKLVEETLALSKGRLTVLNIRVDVVAPATDLMVECRSVQISQVLFNLVQNATDELEKIEGDRWIEIAATDLGNRIELSVGDSGPGIPSHLREVVFESLFTTKANKGTGLGLSVSRRIIEEHKGSLRLDEKSKNTRFVISLPKNQLKETNELSASFKIVA